MKLNFKKIKPKDLSGNPYKDPATITKEKPEGEDMTLDISEAFGQYLHESTGDLGMLIIAQEIYKTGEIEVTDKVRAEILARLEAPNCPFLAVVKQELITKLNTQQGK